MFSLPPVTRGIIIANVAVFLAQQVAGNVLLGLFALWPVGDPLFQPWQVLTYSFLHDGLLSQFQIAHIFFNMFALFMFGTPLERYWGSQRFTTFYFVCVLAAGLTQLTVATFESSQSPTLGASGGIFGLLLAFAIYFPRQRIMLLFPPIPLPAWAFAALTYEMPTRRLTVLVPLAKPTHAPEPLPASGKPFAP